ncbi:MAG: nucleoside-diphosphate sugar epimerase/dehydratase [Clostridia bacterium]
MTKKNLYLLFDVIIVFISVFFAILLRFDLNLPPDYVQRWVDTSISATIILIFFSVLMGSYNTVFTYFGFSELIKQLYISFFSACLLMTLKYLFFQHLSGSIILFACCIFFGFTCLIRAFERIKRWSASKKALINGESSRVLIIGAGGAGTVVAKKFLDDNDGKYPVGLIDDNTAKHGKKISGVKVLGGIDRVQEFAQKLLVDEIVIAIPSATREQTETFCEEALKTGLPVKIFQNEVDVHNYQKGENSGLKEVSIENLLFREPKNELINLENNIVKNKVVLVTGGAGSIGFEICRQTLENKCQQLIVVDISENGLYEVNEAFKEKYNGRYVTALASIRDPKRLQVLFNRYKPEIVFHAAAHKHVPMMEINPFEAVKNNVFGTLNLVEQTIESKVQKFVMISTDKAVHPTNVMGATKRLCELIVKSHSDLGTEMVAVRFGNVLGSNGSVIPLFKRQIANGGPVTVTDPKMTRYFMTIKEAVSLVMLAGTNAKGGELFVLDMGKPIEIYKLAEKMIQLSGKKPNKDIEIKITGLRPGEKLYEELMLNGESIKKTKNKKIFVLKDNGINREKLLQDLDSFKPIMQDQDDREAIRVALLKCVKSYENI